MTDATEPDWTAVRHAYEYGDETMAALARRYGVTRGMVRWRAASQGWQPRDGAISARTLIARLMRILERQVRALEIKMTENDPGDPNLLATLIRSLEKLIAMEATENKAHGKAGPSKEMVALREKLMQRIKDLEQR